MQLNSIEEIIEEIRLGRPVILMDDEDRENEGDLIIAAEKITPEIVNFMTREARGLLCLTLTGERCEFLELPQMVGGAENQSGYGTPFTVSIEAAEGVTTGISAQDRAKNHSGCSQSYVSPGRYCPARTYFPSASSARWGSQSCRPYRSWLRPGKACRINAGSSHY